MIPHTLSLPRGRGLRTLCSSVCWFALLWVCSTPSLAQDISADNSSPGAGEQATRDACQASDTDQTVCLDPVIISISHWDEEQEKSAASVSVLFPDLDRAGPSTDQAAIASATSNVVFQRSNSDERLVIRGLSAFSNSLADPVGYRVNGVSLPLGSMQMPHLFAVDQVTVLKGPQGTLEGRNSEAGLVDVRSVQPGALGGWQSSLGFSSAVGGNGGMAGDASVLYSDRISDRAALTLGVEQVLDQGTISDPETGDDDGGQNRRTNWTTGLHLDLEGDTTVTLSSVGERQHMGKEQFRRIDGTYATDAHESSYSDASWEKRLSTVSSVTVDHSFDDVTLSSITGFTSFDRSFALDYDSSPSTLGMTDLDLQDRMESQELRLTGDHALGGRLKWTSGLYAYHQDTSVDFAMDATSTERRTDISQDGVAAYGFADYALSPRWHMGAGSRVDYIHRSGEQTLISSSGTSWYDAEADDVTLLPKMTLSFQATPSSTLYGSVSRGYLPGGYNFAFASDADSLTYDPEYSWSGELGSKNRFNSGRSTVNLAAFYTRVTDKQITEVIPGASQSISNAAHVTIYGLEGDASQMIGQDWRLRANAGLQHTRAESFQTTVYDSGSGGLVAVDYSGNDVPLAPNFTYGVGVDYVGPGVWSGSVMVNGHSGYYFNAANTLRQSPTATADARIAYGGDGCTVTLWAKNLFNTQTYTQAASSVLGTVVEDGDPLTIGLTTTVSW